MCHSTKCHDTFSRQSEGRHNTLDFAGAKSCAKGRQRPPLGPRRHCLVLCQLTHSFRIWLAPISFERSCYHGEIRGIPVFVSYALDESSKKGRLELNILDPGVCQPTCRFSGVKVSRALPSFSGLSHTVCASSRFLTARPFHRSGCFLFASSRTDFLALRIAADSPR